ncbi:hypothetical protein CS062_22395 [Roseateles chitinivorans]|uniref:HTH tetR-type domain-containing protein n=1 Tax=Roseateles chitinivorans TaxID=2917965 RepID=A0A2G9C3H8_9BURK|nr:hypothetical protein CS062_22395 [Roseateles chitinivorans]
MNPERDTKPAGSAPAPRGRPSRRSMLLSTAIRVLQERGIRNMTLEEVCAASGVSRGAVYWHFRSKEVLVEESLAATTLPLEQLRRESWEDPCATLARGHGLRDPGAPARPLRDAAVQRVGAGRAGADGARAGGGHLVPGPALRGPAGGAGQRRPAAPDTARACHVDGLADRVHGLHAQGHRRRACAGAGLPPAGRRRTDAGSAPSGVSRLVAARCDPPWTGSDERHDP